ncbi:MAG TPA: MerR family transcriptional regulator [Chloroflexota bacterium]|jgi:MerR family redox-sensitive transcriptional activator SoxR
MADDLTITFIARRAGIRASAIRYYESVGLLPAPARINGRRRYDSTILPRLALIATAQEMGFTIKEISTLMHGFDPDVPASARWRVLAAAKLKEVEALIERAEGMRQLLGEALSCGCLSLDSCARAFQTRAAMGSRE